MARPPTRTLTVQSPPRPPWQPSLHADAEEKGAGRCGLRRAAGERRPGQRGQDQAWGARGPGCRREPGCSWQTARPAHCAGPSVQGWALGDLWSDAPARPPGSGLLPQGCAHQKPRYPLPDSAQLASCRCWGLCRPTPAPGRHQQEHGTSARRISTPKCPRLSQTGPCCSQDWSSTGGKARAPCPHLGRGREPQPRPPQPPPGTPCPQQLQGDRGQDGGQGHRSHRLQ